MLDNTNIFNIKDINSMLVSSTLKEVSNALNEKGYNAINQLVGYLISGDPGYISNYKDSRKKITKLDRTEILENLLQNYLEK